MKIEAGKALAELDVKPGDVVYFHNPKFHRGKNITIGAGTSSLSNDPYWHIVSRANEPDKPKTWGEMTDAEKGALLLGAFSRSAIEHWGPNLGEWIECGSVIITNFADHIAYRIKPEPKCETVTLYIDNQDGVWYGAQEPLVADKGKVTFDTIDRKPDCNSIRMEAIGDE